MNNSVKSAHTAAWSFRRTHVLLCSAWPFYCLCPCPVWELLSAVDRVAVQNQTSVVALTAEKYRGADRKLQEA